MNSSRSPHGKSPSADRLETLCRVSQALASTLHLDEVLDAIMDQVIAVTGAERGCLMLGAGTEDLKLRVARGLDQTAVAAPEFQVSRGVIQRVAGEGKAVLASDALAEEWLAGRKSVVAMGLRSIMCAPLLLHGRPIGLVYVDNRLQAGIFDADDLDLLQVVANTAAVAIENARLHEHEVKQARLEQELELARRIQTSLIPRGAPQFPGYEIAGYGRFAREVGGDFYDFIPRPGGGLGIVIGDVTGKGIPAAFFMALARTTIRSSLAAAVSASQGLQQANELISADASSGMFVTLYYVGLEPGSHVLTCVNAGHNPPLLVRVAERSASPLPVGGLPLGIDGAGAFASTQVELARGDTLLLYTDGLVDAESAGGEFYGLQRLCTTTRGLGRMSAAAMVEAIGQSVETHASGRPAFDDLTLVAVRDVG